jgi:cytochrome c553
MYVAGRHRIPSPPIYAEADPERAILARIVNRLSLVVKSSARKPSQEGACLPECYVCYLSSPALSLTLLVQGVMWHPISEGNTAEVQLSAKTTAKRGTMWKIIIKHGVLVATSVLLLSLVAASARGQEAKQLYEQTCAACHGASGKGDGPTGQALQPKPADLATALRGKDEAYLTKVITEGGTGVGKSPMMPGYQGVFSDEQIQGLIQYMKGFAAP